MPRGTIEDRLERSGLTHGPVSGYLIDAGLIAPSEAQIEAIEFHVDVDPDGSIAAQSESVRISPGFSFLFSSMYAGRSIASTGEAELILRSKLHLVSFNVQNEGRNKAVFRRPIPMNILACPSGPAHELEWHSIFRFYESADISVDWQIDQAAYAANPVALGQARYTVLLVGDIVNDSVLPKVER